ncbi:MAG: hypothetical protein ACO31I_10405 [Prochlorotrichaceae cyanobacterium]|jgi:hypothetical protein
MLVPSRSRSAHRQGQVLSTLCLLSLVCGLASCSAETIAQPSIPNPNIVTPPSPLPLPNSTPGEFDPFGTSAPDTPETDRRPVATPDYLEVINRTKNMVYDDGARSLVQDFGLSLLNVTWEDTGRFYNSAVGPNISDMTIQVQSYDAPSDRYQLHLMPVIRYDNFSDRSADILLSKISLLVGNEKGEDTLEKVPLRSILANLRDYLHDGDSWAGQRTSLLAKRDSHVLVSAQACFLPIPQQGMAQFNPVLFNYQSYAENPAVLTLLATREGTSVTIIDNTRDSFEAGATWGQRLFFNKNGERASFTGQRIRDFLTETSNGEAVSEETIAAAEEKGLNLVLLIQVPLKQRPQPRQNAAGSGIFPLAAAPSMEAESFSDRAASDVETAVIGHGEVEGPFTEIDNLAIERDPDFPIRVTVQFYKGTSNGIVSRQDIAEIKDQIERVYADADYVGSLVTDGPTGRPTEYTGSKQEPPDWWEDFWQRYETNTGESREAALRRLRELRGQDWMPRSPAELETELQENP